MLINNYTAIVRTQSNQSMGQPVMPLPVILTNIKSVGYKYIDQY